MNDNSYFDQSFLDELQAEYKAAKAAKAIPATTSSRCGYYQASVSSCECRDRRGNRGGSYTDAETNERICKHIAHRRAQKAARVARWEARKEEWRQEKAKRLASAEINLIDRLIEEMQAEVSATDDLLRKFA